MAGCRERIFSVTKEEKTSSSIQAGAWATKAQSSSKIEHLTKRRKADTKQKRRQSLNSCLRKGVKAIVVGW